MKIQHDIYKPIFKKPHYLIIFLFLFGLILFFSSCKKNVKKQTVFSLNDFYSKNSFLKEKTDSIFNSMSDEQKVSQIFVAPLGHSEDSFNEITTDALKIVIK